MSFDFFGVTLQIESDGACAPVIRQLDEDFAHFISPPPATKPQLKFLLRGAPAPDSASRGLVPLFQNKMAQVSGWGYTRFCDYGDIKVLCVEDHCSRTFRFFGMNPDEMHEAVYTTILSAVGECLDAKGMHRAHALGIQLQGANSLILLPSGGGKSAMALILLATSETMFFSDETPLLKNGCVFPFPVRIAIRPEVAQTLRSTFSLPEHPIDARRFFRRKRYPSKELFSLPAARVAASGQISHLLIGRFTSGKPQIWPASKIRAFAALSHSLILGLGIAQMAEHMLRPPRLFHLIRIAFSRLVEAVKILACARVYVFEVNSDALQNAAVLQRFFEGDVYSAEDCTLKTTSGSEKSVLTEYSEIESSKARKSERSVSK